MKDKLGQEIHHGMYLASEYDEHRLRFVYHIDGSWSKPYIYRQVDGGPLEVVGRANHIDLSKLQIIEWTN